LDLKHLLIACRRIGTGRLEDVTVVIERISDGRDTVTRLDAAAPTDHVADDGEEDKCQGGTYDAYAIPGLRRVP
jgi:hypothetical protein